MLTTEDIQEIQKLSALGIHISEISRITGRDRKTVRKCLAEKPGTYRVPKTDPYKQQLGQWYAQAKRAGRELRACDAYKRLQRETEYTGSYSLVQRYLHDMRQNEAGERDAGERDAQTETAGRTKRKKISQAARVASWEEERTRLQRSSPGVAHIGFFETEFHIDTLTRRRKILFLTFPHSHKCLSQVLGEETSPCICQAIQDIFRSLGGVPMILRFSSARTIGMDFIKNMHRDAFFLQLRSHYGFLSEEITIGWEKCQVSNRSRYLCEREFTPAEQLEDLAKYNRELLQWEMDMTRPNSRRRHNRANPYTARVLEKTNRLFAEDVEALRSLPSKRVDICTPRSVQTDAKGRICIDEGHFYTIDPERPRQTVQLLMRTYSFDVLDANGKPTATFARSYI